MLWKWLLLLAAAPPARIVGARMIPAAMMASSSPRPLTLMAAMARRMAVTTRGSGPYCCNTGQHFVASYASLLIAKPVTFQCKENACWVEGRQQRSQLMLLRASSSEDNSSKSCSKNNDAEYDDDSFLSEEDDGQEGEVSKTRFRARVAYLGTPFHGWQLQPNRMTIQGEIEDVLDRRFRRRVPVLGAGRTDAGVHARGQAVHFDLFPGEIPFVPPKEDLLRKLNEEVIELVDSTTTTMVIEAENDQEQKIRDDFCSELQHSMNRMLPSDIRLFNLQLAPYTWSSKSTKRKQPLLRPWHAIQSASSKWYSYRFTLGPTLWNPMDRFTRTHFVHRPYYLPISAAATTTNEQLKLQKSACVIEPYALTKTDIDRLQSILRIYEGTHDFKAFGGQLEQNEKRAGRRIDTVRKVYRVELVKEPLKESYQFGKDRDAVFDDIYNHENDGSLPITTTAETPVTTTLSLNDGGGQNQLGFVGEEGNYRIDFLLQGALYKMVRNMVGTAIEVWLGRMSEEQLIGLLQKNHDNRGDGAPIDAAGEDVAVANNNNNNKKFGRKDNPCKPAPPEGLTLECVYYDDNF